MKNQLLIAGGGIGGMAAALAAARAGWQVRLLERSEVFSEVGAGVQLGPNVVRVLHAWGLEGALRDVAAWPTQLQVRCARTGRVLAVMPLGAQMQARYGAPYAAIHRADLHTLLLEAARAQPQVQLQTGMMAQSVQQQAHAVQVQAAPSRVNGKPVEIEADALLCADGGRSRLRQQVLHCSAPPPSGHLAYRAALAQSALPERLRTQQVTVWLGAHLHIVQYPLRGGAWQNMVAILEGQAPPDLENWDHAANASQLEAALAGACTALQDAVRAIPAAGVQWRLWPLADRPPMAGADEMVQGRVALLGDAAHPMLPYLAQGAGMAIEDAAELESVLAMDAIEVPLRLRRYALNRWQRNARVQARARRNGRIFHATGLLRWGRDTGLRLMGERLIDVPWLYRAPS